MGGAPSCQTALGAESGLPGPPAARRLPAGFEPAIASAQWLASSVDSPWAWLPCSACSPLLWLPQDGAAHARAATTIFTEAKTAMMNATSFHVLGHFGSGAGETTIDMSMSPSKGGGSFQPFPGGTMEVVVTASTVYIRADERTWQELTGSDSTAELVANRWVKEPEANPSYPSIVEFTDSRRFVGLLTTGLAGFSEFAAQARFRGRPAVVLTDSEHDKILNCRQRYAVLT